MPRNNETAAIAHSTAIGQVIERLLIPGLIPELTMRSSNKFKNQQFIGSESSKGITSVILFHGKLHMRKSASNVHLTKQS